MRVLFLALFLTLHAVAGTFVNQTLTAGDASSSATTVTAATSATTGNLLVGIIAYNDPLNSITLSSIADTAGNTYTAGAKVFNSSTLGHQASYMFYAKNITGNASNVVTVTLSLACVFRTLIVQQFSGLDTTSPLDVEATPTFGNGTTLTSNAFTTTNANDQIVVMTQVNSSATAGAGYTLRSNGNYAAGEEKHVTAIQTAVTATMTQASSGDWNIHVMAFKDASAGGASATHRVIVQ